PGETEEDFQATLDLMETVQFDAAFMFHYSERDGTFAARKRPDNIPLALKKSRLQRLINMQEAICKVRNNDKVGTVVEVLVKGPGRRNPEQMIGRSSCFRTTILPQGNYGAGDTISVRIVGSTSHTLFGEPVEGVATAAATASPPATLSA
ncbi:MAG: tRNA-2-methylthio-N6-dimethylallyladenosine synthase, partial [Bradymonadia bacterium]